MKGRFYTWPVAILIGSVGGAGIGALLRALFPQFAG